MTAEAPPYIQEVLRLRICLVQSYEERIRVSGQGPLGFPGSLTESLRFPATDPACSCALKESYPLLV